MLKNVFFATLFTVALWLSGAGCVIVPARYATAEDGRVVLVEPAQVIVPAPVVVAYDYYPPPRSVIYRRSYYRPVVIQVGRPTYVIGGHHHYRYRR